MSDTRWGWQDYYLEAFLETNSLKLVGRIAVAEKAIFLRAIELRGSSDAEVERQAIANAVSALSILKRESNSSIGIKAEQEGAKARACFD
jgi:hypothetical protein